MLTKSNVMQLRSYLKDTLIICDQMIQTRDFNQLFTSDKDYRDSKIAAKILPTQFFHFRMFDTSIELCYNSRTKQYYIGVDTHEIPFSIVEFNKEFTNPKVFEKYSPQSIYKKSFIFTKETSFESAVYFYKEFIRFYLYKDKGDLLPDIF